MKKILSALAFMLAALVAPTHAADFPTKPVTIITSFPVGSGPDGYARQLTESLTKKLGVPVILDNRPGANGVVSLEAFNRAPRDGHTVYFTDPTIVNGYQLVYSKDNLTVNLKTLVPATMTDLVLVTSTKINSYSELKQAMEKNPSYGSWAVGSTGQMYSEQLARYMKVTATHIPYRDYGQWFIDLSNQAMPYSFATMASAQALERAGKIKFLAIAASHRDPMYPAVPTIDELVGKKTGIYGPRTGAAFYISKDIPADAENSLRNAFKEALQTPNVKEAIASRNYKHWTINSDAGINKAMAEDASQYYQLIKDLSIDIRIVQ